MVYAQVNIGQTFEPAIKLPTVGKLFSTLLPNIYILAGLILFFLLVFGGISFIMGAGQDDPKRAEQGKNAITYAIIGFLIIFASYWIIQIIEVVTGLNIFQSGL